MNSRHRRRAARQVRVDHHAPVRQSGMFHHTLIATLIAAASLGPTVPARAQTPLPATATAPGDANTPSHDGQQTYHIAAGPLDDALISLGNQSGLMIGADTALTRGVQSPGVDGRYDTRAALAALLAGTGIEAIRADNGAYTLRRIAHDTAPRSPIGESALSPVRVKARQATAWSHTDGYVATQTASGTKTDTSLLETPQSISIITADQITDQAAQSVGASLRYSPGVRGDAFGVTTDRDYVRVRGFMPNFYLDGLMLPYGLGGQGAQLDPYGLERVEVVRGPSSVLFGQNPPGGIISMVSKRPTVDPVQEVEVQTGSFGRVQGAVDLGGAVDQDKTLLYRFVALRRSSGTQVDGADDNRTYVAPSLTYRPNASTSLTVLAQYQRDDAGIATQYYPAYGTLYGNPNGSIGSNVNVGDPSRDHLKRKYYAIGYAFEHQLNDDWMVKQSARYARSQVHNFSTWGNGFVTNAATGLPTDYETLLRRATDINRAMTEYTIDNQLQGRFATSLFGQSITHTVLAGFDFRREMIDNRTGTVAANSIDIFDPDAALSIGNISYTANNRQSLNQYGAYFQDQLGWRRWRLTLSGRNDWSYAGLTNRNTNGTTRADDSAFTGRVGLSYQFDNGIAPYVSYSTSFEPQIGTMSPANGNAPYDPTKGKQVELGVKYQPTMFDGFFAASVFDMWQKNVLTPDPDNILYAVQTGKVRSRGVELEARAAVTSHVKLIATYSYTDTDVLSSNTPSQLHKRLALIPAQQASLWATYRFDARFLPGLEVGAGVRYIGSTYGDSANLWKTPGYTIFDAMVRYDLGVVSPRLKGATIAVNLQNLTDREYLTGCQSAGSCEFGERRTVLATLRYRW